jgi:hypothetical protein
MSEQHPDIEIPPIRICTTDPSANSHTHYGVVSSEGSTPGKAFSSLRETAERWGRNIVLNIWENKQKRVDYPVVMSGNVIRAVFLIANSGLAAGVLENGEPGWVAYGTLVGWGGIKQTSPAGVTTDL